MWKLIDCGTHPWFVKTTPKYYHCVYSFNGEYKKLHVNKKRNIPSSRDRMYLTYLKTWPLDTAKCIMDKKTYKFLYQHWKKLNKTIPMKEILKQLKNSRVASS